MNTGNSIRIFIATENTFSCSMYQQYLFSEGYEDVTAFTDSTSLLAAFEVTGVPDIVFLEYTIQFPDTGSVLQRIKQFDPAIYVVLIAEQEDRHNAANLLQLGAFDFLVKSSGDGHCMSRIIKKIKHLKACLQIRMPLLDKEDEFVSCR